MPEFLPPPLVELRDRTERVAAELAVLRDDPALEPPERNRRVRAATEAAGIRRLTLDPAAGGCPTEPALTLLVVREALARHGVGHLPGVLASGPGLLAGVGEPLRSTHLLPLLAGEKRAGFAFTEPVGAPPSRARPDGDELVVTGQKSYVTGGADADFLTATVEVDGEGPAMVVIDVDRPGVTISRRFASFDGSQHAAFAFRDVRVPRHCVLGAPGEGRSKALERISEVRRAITADCVGTAMWLLELVEDHLRTERRDGRRPGDEQRARLRFGELRVQVYATRSTAYRTARLADAGHDVINESIAAKLLASEVANAVADGAVQLLGGEALIEGHPVERTYRRLRTLRLAEGESDVLRVNVARGRLELERGRL